MKDNKEKGCNPTDQSMGNNQIQIFKSILSKNEDIDNDVIYSISTGETIREL